jgi:hypothetical protein
MEVLMTLTLNRGDLNGFFVFYMDNPDEPEIDESIPDEYYDEDDDDYDPDEELYHADGYSDDEDDEDDDE